MSKTKAPARKATGRQKPIEVYFWPTPNGYKITCALEEMGLPYAVKPVNIARGEQFKPEFLKIAPNNRMPAIIDPNGPGGKPISVFESGAILQYLGRKTGKFYPKDERKRVEVEEWLMWQMGGIGPMMGQANHFVRYAPEKIEYAVNRYVNETRRLLGVLDKRLAKRKFVCGELSIADFALLGWVRIYHRLDLKPEEAPNVVRWIKDMEARPATRRGLDVKVAEAGKIDIAKDKEAWKLLFTQGARA
ncbi:MAG TPA: glutathione binding-like protein [Xanthobacteraceae bacterium]|nr:glutathione binding-like protein [Xanthobacteraceae bacterium]